MPIKTEGFEEDSEDGLFILLKVTYTAKYPEELPLLELEECVNIDEYDLRSHLMEHLTEQVIIGKTDFIIGIKNLIISKKISILSINESMNAFRWKKILGW